MRKKILYLVPEIEFTEIQKEWLLHPHEDNRPLFKQYFNDYSYVTINPDLHLWEFKIVKAAVDWLCYHYADKSFSETQLQTLVELILNRELQPNEKPHITDAWALWCINYEDFEGTQNIVSNIVRQYAVHSDAGPEYSCLIPAQLALFLMTASSSQINSFWDSLRTEMKDIIILANTIQKHVNYPDLRLTP